MIRKLRIQFIGIIMAIAAVMVVAILVTVVNFTADNMRTETVSMMQSMARDPEEKDRPEEQKRPEEEKRPGRLPMDIRLPHFAVDLDREGEVLDTRGEYFDLSDREYVLEIVQAALSTGKESGRLEDYSLRFIKREAPFGQTLVFADVTADTATLRGLIANCAVIFLGAMLLFLGISILLSRWMIRPVETAWNQQRQFVADASHELKTPLAVIMANAELLQNEETTEEERETFSRSILSMSYQMRSLVESMLEMARVDNGAAKMQLGPVDYSQLVSDAVLSFQLLYEERNMVLSAQIPEGITLRGSEQHLYQVMDVLLDNALKYSTPESTVTVGLKPIARACLLSVSGPGEALSKEELKNIFKRFYRADKARAMNGSYGLGLAIAESIVTAHKGKIWAKSEGGNNAFYVWLPLS